MSRISVMKSNDISKLAQKDQRVSIRPSIQNISQSQNLMWTLENIEDLKTENQEYKDKL